MSTQAAGAQLVQLAHANLFVTNLPAHDEEFIRQLFVPFGGVERLRLVRRPSKSFALVQLRGIAEAADAISRLDCALLGNRVLRVKLADRPPQDPLGSSSNSSSKASSTGRFALPAASGDAAARRSQRRHSVSWPRECSVYIKGLPAEATRLWLFEHFAPFGGVLSVALLEASPGVGFVNYADAASAARAVAAMAGRVVSGDQRLRVALQEPRG